MNKKQHILSLSYGKDSLACLGAIELLGWPLDRIVHVEVWATDTVPADLPPMVEFKEKADKIIQKRWGIEVEHVRGERTYQNVFYQVVGKGKRFGEIYGWRVQGRAWCNSRLKTSVLDRVKKNGTVYLGIAADEPKRFKVLSQTAKSPLVKLGWTEADCWDWCEKNDLLSPIYRTAARGGCWFCHNQRVQQLRFLRKNYPEYWALMLQWDRDSPVSFNADGHTIHDFEQRFRLEDEGFLSPDEPFRWSTLGMELNPICQPVYLQLKKVRESAE